LLIKIPMESIWEPGERAVGIRRARLINWVKYAVEHQLVPASETRIGRLQNVAAHVGAADYPAAPPASGASGRSAEIILEPVLHTRAPSDIWKAIAAVP